MKLLILNGPNLNLLGLREPDIYGRQNYAALVRFCEDTCREADISCKVFQSNHEGALVDEIQAAYPLMGRRLKSRVRQKIVPFWCSSG